MNKKNLIPILAFVAVVFTASTVLAANHGMKRPGGGMGPGYGYNYGQNLTQEQMDTLNSLQQEHFNAMNGLRSEMFQKRAELDRLLSNPESDRAAVNQAMDELNQVRNKMMNERLDFNQKLADAGIDAPIGRGGYGRGGYGSGQGVNPCGYGGCPGQGYGQGYGKGFGPGHGRGCPGQGFGRGQGYGPHHMGQRGW